MRDRVHYQFKSIGCSASYETAFAWVFNLTHGLGVRWTIEPSADDGQKEKEGVTAALTTAVYLLHAEEQ